MIGGANAAMSDRFTLRTWAIVTGTGNLLERHSASPSWCPIV